LQTNGNGGFTITRRKITKNSTNEKSILSKKNILEKYEKIFNDIVNILGNDVTYNNQLEDLAKKTILNDHNFLGIFPQDFNNCILNDYKKCCLIFNTSPLNKSGEHWCGLWKENEKIYIFDSFGRNPQKLVPILHNNLGGNIYYDDDKNQKNNEANCGQRTLAWLICCVKYGIKNAIKI
jgi:hypothetical protein